jgi:hypothetical protein
LGQAGEAGEAEGDVYQDLSLNTKSLRDLWLGESKQLDELLLKNNQ